MTSSTGPARRGAEGRLAIKPKGICIVGMCGKFPTANFVRKGKAECLRLVGTDNKRRIKTTGSSVGGS